MSELAASALYDYLVVETAGETDPIVLAQAFEAPQAAANGQKLSDLARVRCLSPRLASLTRLRTDSEQLIGRWAAVAPGSTARRVGHGRVLHRVL